MLDDLVRNGVVIAEPAGRAKLYTLNHEHVAYSAIVTLARLRELLLERLKAEADSWEVPAEAVWLFGSTARGQGGTDSDLDLLIVRRDDVDESDPRWLEQVETLTQRATLWSGNSCQVVEYSAQEVRDLIDRGERLVTDSAATPSPSPALPHNAPSPERPVSGRARCRRTGGVRFGLGLGVRHQARPVCARLDTSCRSVQLSGDSYTLISVPFLSSPSSGAV